MSCFSAFKVRKASFGVGGGVEQLAGGQEAKQKHRVETGNKVKKKRRVYSTVKSFY